ncbi:hypothetical protein Tco_0782087, partial [Tanacetum coccineum]
MKCGNVLIKLGARSMISLKAQGIKALIPSALVSEGPRSKGVMAAILLYAGAIKLAARTSSRDEDPEPEGELIRLGAAPSPDRLATGRANGKAGAAYIESLRQMHQKDAEKLAMLKELLRLTRQETFKRQFSLDKLDDNYEMVFGGMFLLEGISMCPSVVFSMYYGLSIRSSTLSLVDRDGSSVSGVILLLLDGCSRTSVTGEVVVSADGKASNGGAVAFKTASKVKFGFPGLAFLPKRGNDCVAVRDKGMWLKQVIVVVAVPSSITALKQYLLVI